MRYFVLLKNLKKSLSVITAVFIAACELISAPYNVAAEELTRDDINAARMAMSASSDSIPGWPASPTIGAESAVLMDADTGVILYSKNADVVHYPASTTKVMTCLLAAENCSLDEIVTFSHEAVYGIDRGSSNVGIDEGQAMTMEEALYCVMLASANEVASAVAEHVGGTIENFAKMMNERAAELGCTNTHFVNANGLPNEEHWTTAHDLALITRAFNNNETLRRIAGTNYYKMEASVSQPDAFDLANHHKMYPGNSYAYEYVTWGKTGYTNVARETLVTCAEKNGMNLVCTIMKAEPPYQYTDTRDLFEYGFNNFQKLYVDDNETTFNLDSSDFFDTDSSIFGSTKSLLELDSTGYCIVPNTVNFDDLEYSISYDTDSADDIADINYSYEGVYVGGTSLKMTDPETSDFSFGTASVSGNVEPVSHIKEEDEKERNIIYVNIKMLFIIIGITVVLLILILIFWLLFRKNSYSNKRRRNILKRNRRYGSEFDDFDFK